jgi:uncharacterized protein YlzI (FlbEa/FlbD family)
MGKLITFTRTDGRAFHVSVASVEFIEDDPSGAATRIGLTSGASMLVTEARERVVQLVTEVQRWD